MKRWHFTLALGISYLAVFHLWMVLPAPWVFASGAAASVVLAATGWRVWRKRYFVNAWDAGFHAAVILDVFLEAWLVKLHEDFGFYWCAAGFGIVLTSYRWMALTRLGRSKANDGGAPAPVVNLV